MQGNRVQIPEGLREYMGQEAYQKMEVQAQLRKNFRLFGYDEIQTPSFEYAAVFEGQIGFDRQDKMIRFFDTDGRTLVLRPDFTMPVGRMAAARREELPSPARLFYIGSAFGLEHDYGHQRREFTQAGAELLGAADYSADAEMIALAIESMASMGLKQFSVDLGHVGFFMALTAQSGLNRAQAGMLRRMIDSKNTAEAQDYLADMGLSKERMQNLLALIGLYGGQEVLEEANRFGGLQCEKALADLRGICKLLTAFGFGGHITIDLGQLPDIDYYTGQVFRGMADGLGYPILSGGRYDGVLGLFGRPMAATGFALGVERALAALDAGGQGTAMPAIACLIGAAPGYESDAYALAAQLRAEGRRAIMALHTGEAELMAEGIRLGAEGIAFCSRAGQGIKAIEGGGK